MNFQYCWPLFGTKNMLFLLLINQRDVSTSVYKIYIIQMEVDSLSVFGSLIFFLHSIFIRNQTCMQIAITR